jgi:hypothetical protein
MITDLKFYSLVCVQIENTNRFTFFLYQRVQQISGTHENQIKIVMFQSLGGYVIGYLKRKKHISYMATRIV